MMFTGLRADLLASLRMLTARPGFACAIIATLALGIGANSAIFSVINGLVLRPLPYPHSAQLVYIYNSYPKMNQEASGMTVPLPAGYRQGTPLRPIRSRRCDMNDPIASAAFVGTFPEIP